MGGSSDRHCEHGEAIQKVWIAAPPVAARDDEIDDFQIAKEFYS